MIGWEDESYLGYNFQTGKYAELENVSHSVDMIFHSFSDLFIYHLKINSHEDELKEFFREYLEQTKKEDIKYQDEQLALGDAYFKGEGVEQDYAKAYCHYREAAEREHPESPSAAEAQYKLGLCYENGQGVKQSVWEADYWYYMAGKHGHQKAKDKRQALKNSGALGG